MAAQRWRTGAVPSLPQVVVAILDQLQRAAIPEAEIAAWVRKDPGIAAELLVSARAVSASGAPHCHSLESAVTTLGSDAAKALVLDAASRVFFAPHDSALFGRVQRTWRFALMAADLAQVLATLTRYRDPEQARLCGLLLGVGPLALAAREGSAQAFTVDSRTEPEGVLEAQRALSGTDQVAIGVQLAKSWCPDSFAVDAMRYQFASLDQVEDAHQLVKIVNLAWRLAAGNELGGDAVHGAKALFGLDAELTRALCERVAMDIDRLAVSLGVQVAGIEPEALASSAYRELGQRLDLIGRMARARTQLREAHGAAALRATVPAVVRRVLGLEDSLLFLADAKHSHLSAWLEGDDEPSFVLALTPGRSLVAKALLETTAQRSEVSAVVDHQLADLLQTDQLWCLPLVHEESRLGVLVLGVPPGRVDDRVRLEALALALANEIAAVLSQRSVGSSESGAVQAGVQAAAMNELRFAASTPLSVIHNHLEMLRTRIGDDVAAQEDVERIRDETKRIEQLLGEAETPRLLPVEREVGLNDLVHDVAASLGANLLAPAGIILKVDVDPRAPRVGGTSGLQPLLRQLLRRAGETLPSGSEVVVSTRGQVSVNGREHVELEVRDHVPGLPEEPPRWLGGQRGESKAGQPEDFLGRVRELTEAMGGTMILSSDRSGSRFRFLLPVGSPGGRGPSSREVT